VAVSATLSQLIGKPFTPPEITADTIPAEAIQKLDAALSVTLPETFGTLVVYDSGELATVRDAVNAARKALIAIVILFVLAVIVALWVSPRRRRTLLQLSFAIVAVTIIERRLGISSVDDVVALARPENQAAVRAIAEALVGWFLDYTVWFLAIALVTGLVALITGPYAWAVAFRAGVADLARNTVHTDGSVEADRTSRWVAARRTPVMVGIGVLAIAVLGWADLSLWWAVLVIVVAVGLGFVAWRVVRAPSGEPAPA
jgi:hypothetical protein